ncbi:MAG: mannose-6-phosphate isomerase, class I [Clostridium sp.]|nr:mannose-6-phosphate isomerase, class I [Clostridium sp.]
MYPIKFDNIYYKKIWGGRDLESFRDNLPDGDIGESWDIACHPNGTGVVSNGPLKGKNLLELCEEYGEELVGSKFNHKKFPLLVKLINSKGKLSVQVHPNDEYAKRVENESGKTEAWYVVDAKPGAKIVVGTKKCNKELFKKAIDEGKTEEFLNIIEVKKGDCFLIRSGLIHAICEGLIIAEIQQNCDITYRLYDYGRPRELHIEKALEAIDFNLEAINENKNKLEEFENYNKTTLCKCDYFTIEKFEVKDEVESRSSNECFYILTCVDGNGELFSEEETLKINKGDSILIPSSLGKYKVKGKMTILKSYA